MAQKTFKNASEFQGYTSGKLEGIDNKLNEICLQNKDQDQRLNKAENQLTAVKIKGGIFGTIGGLIGGFLGGLLR